GGGGMTAKDAGRQQTPRPRATERRAVYIISVAAELSGVHPQTLRMYERRGLLMPERTSGNTRRYSERDIERIRMIQELTQREGVSLAGVKLFIEMREQLDQMRRRTERLERELLDRVKAAAPGTDILPMRSLVHFAWDEEPTETV
ncbi:MAG TPA: helix-turn-helix transcriptional regulator, partial [Actinomycetota bacterium]|nr:helix-turn-helix transcriptional regulator [Actinomycetota bacterium]